MVWRKHPNGQGVKVTAVTQRPVVYVVYLLVDHMPICRNMDRGTKIFVLCPPSFTMPSSGCALTWPVYIQFYVVRTPDILLLVPTDNS